MNLSHDKLHTNQNYNSTQNQFDSNPHISWIVVLTYDYFKSTTSNEMKLEIIESDSEMQRSLIQNTSHIELVYLICNRLLYTTK